MGNLVKFRGGGIVLKSLPFVLDCGFAEIGTGAYPCFSKLSVCFKLRGKGDLRLGGCPLAVKTGYQLVCISGSPVKFQGGGVVLKFDVLQHWNAVFVQFACKQ